MAVTVTDGFQIILVMVGVVWITVAALGDIGGLSGLNASLTAIQSELPEGYNVFMDSEKFKSLLWMILPGLMYIMIGQDIYQRLFACKDHKTAIKASVCSAVLVCIVSVMPVTLGLIARVKHPELATAGTSAAAFATSDLCNNRHEHPPWLGCWHYYCCGAFCYFFYSGLLPVGSRIALYD